VVAAPAGGGGGGVVGAAPSFVVGTPACGGMLDILLRPR